MAKNKLSENASSGDIKSVVEDIDIGARNPTNWQGKLIAAISLMWSLFQLYIASSFPYTLAELTQLNSFIVSSDTARVIHLAFGIALSYLVFPLFKASSRSNIPWYDWILVIVGIVATLYLVVNQSEIADRSGLPTTADLFISACGMVVILLATYRALGLPMVIVAMVFLVYVFFGNYSFIPDSIQWKGASFGKAMWHFWMQTEGVFGIALSVSTSLVFLFVLFGSLLEKAGAGNYFITLSFSLMGHLKGGPAKAAVIASAATGMISGSSIANTVTTGTFTIPLMKKVGFSAEKAGAVEVASSTNGQLTPPVMGAAAFLMVEYVGISYLEVVKHAFLPAIISYIALFYIVHLESEKMGLKGLPRTGPIKTISQKLMGYALALAVFSGVALFIYYGLSWVKPLLGDYTFIGMSTIFLLAYLVLINWASRYPDLKVDDKNAGSLKFEAPGKIAKTGAYFSLPIIVLIWCLIVERFSPGLSALWASLSMMFVMLTQDTFKAYFRGEFNLGAKVKKTITKGWGDMIAGLIAGARNMIGIAVATGTAGIIVGTVSLTGAHQVIGGFIEVISGGSLFLMLVFVALFSLILGMGLPTTATYIVITSLMAPVIVAVGAKSGLIVPLIAVHMFVFYFGILADDTPPVGLAAFAAAAISKGDPIKTGIIGFSYDIRTAILPFLFIFNTELLLIDVSPLKAVFVFIVATIAMMLFVAASQNWFITKSKMWESLALLLIAFTLFNPGFWLNQFQDPYVKKAATEIHGLANLYDDNKEIRIRMSGENFVTGKIVETTVALPLGLKNSGDGTKRLKSNAGIVFREELGKVYVDKITFGAFAHKKGIDLGWQVKYIEEKADRIYKEIFYIPALLLLGLIVYLQTRKERKITPV